MGNKIKKTIAVHISTKIRLSEMGRFGESFDDIINRLLDFYEENTPD